MAVLGLLPGVALLALLVVVVRLLLEVSLAPRAGRRADTVVILLKGEVAHLGAFGGAHPRASRDPPSAVRGGGEK